MHSRFGCTAFQLHGRSITYSLWQIIPRTESTSVHKPPTLSVALFSHALAALLACAPYGPPPHRRTAPARARPRPRSICTWVPCLYMDKTAMPCFLLCAQFCVSGATSRSFTEKASGTVSVSSACFSVVEASACASPASFALCSSCARNARRSSSK